MGWKTVVGTGSVIMAAAVGCWWAVAASAAPPVPVIGPALVVTPAAGIPSPESAVPSRSAATAVPTVSGPSSPSVSPSATSTRDIEAPEVVDPNWVRPVDGDKDDGAEVDDD